MTQTESAEGRGSDGGRTRCGHRIEIRISGLLPIGLRHGLATRSQSPVRSGGWGSLRTINQCHEAHLRRDLRRQALEQAGQRGPLNRSAYAELMHELDLDSSTVPTR